MCIRDRYIKKPENFLRENLFMQYLKGENDGSVGRDTGTHEKSLNELMQECGEMCIRDRIGTGAVISAVDWKMVVSSAIVAGIVSWLTSLAGIPEVEEE